MEGEGGSGAEMVSDALGRLFPWQGKDYMTSLKMKGSLKEPFRWEWVWVERGLLEKQRMRKGSSRKRRKRERIYEGGRKEFPEVAWCQKRTKPWK